MSEHDDGSEDVFLDRAVLLGVWVNGTRAHLSRDEITIDFVREVAECRAPFSSLGSSQRHVPSSTSVTT